jgi:hypothetical protein
MKWEEEFKQKEKMLRSMSEFPDFHEQRNPSLTVYRMNQSGYRLP